jgi:hypothetical protein
MISSTNGFVPLEKGQRLYYQLIGEGPQDVIIPAGHLLAADFNNLRSEDRCRLFYINVEEVNLIL